MPNKLAYVDLPVTRDLLEDPVFRLNEWAEVKVNETAKLLVNKEYDIPRDRVRCEGIELKKQEPLKGSDDTIVLTYHVRVLWDEPVGVTD